VSSRGSLPLLLLLAVTVLWGYTFVAVRDAVAVYPLFGFLCVRFAISTAVLAPFAWRPLRRLPRGGWLAGTGVGLVLASAYALQTAGLHLGTVSSAGLITGLYVVFTPLITLGFFGTRVPLAGWLGIASSLAGLALLSGMPGGSLSANALLLGNAIAQSVQIASMERFAPRYDARALTFLQMGVCCLGFTVIALALGQTEAPHGSTVWSALIVTGVFAGALGYLIATWVQARTTAARAALVFMLEAPFAALFGVLLAGDRLGWIGWGGCALMLAGIAVAEPAAAEALQRLLPGRARGPLPAPR
jgi:drug/metabolite transporter (DMT)-like permease